LNGATYAPNGRRSDLIVDVVASLASAAMLATLRVGDSELIRLDMIARHLRLHCSLGFATRSSVHHPFRNVGRAGIAWVTAAPSLSDDDVELGRCAGSERPMNMFGRVVGLMASRRCRRAQHAVLGDAPLTGAGSEVRVTAHHASWTPRELALAETHSSWFR
jgi:hypothetical protein